MHAFRTIRPWMGFAILCYGALAFTPALAGHEQESSSKNTSTPRKPLVSEGKGATTTPKDLKLVTSADPPVAPANLAPDPYTIGIGDELQISVWHEPELSLEVVVRPDGMISMPLLNDVKVVGLRPLELQALLTEKLKGFVKDPEVTIIVRAIRSRFVYVMGQVGHQGALPLNGRKTMLELIADVGGLGPFAKADSIYIIRNVNGRIVRIPFSYKKAIKGLDLKDDVVLLPGDTIVVP